MQQIFVTQYVVAGEPHGFPGDPLVFDDEARAATVEALLERAKSSGLLALVCSSLDKLGKDTSDHIGCNRAKGHDSVSAAVGRLRQVEEQPRLLDQPDVQHAREVIRAGKMRDLHTFHCWMVGNYIHWAGKFLATSQEEALGYWQQSHHAQEWRPTEGGYLRGGNRDWGVFRLVWTRDHEPRPEEGNKR